VTAPSSWPPAPAAADASWTLAPGPILLVLILGALYLPRWWRVRREHGTTAAPVWRLCSFLAGLACLIVALVSPIDRLAEQSFTMHMTQHVLLIDIVPITLIAGLTKVILRPLTRRLTALERALGPLMHPAAAVALYVAVMWIWHVPSLYDAALESETVHVLEHMTFLSAGLLYWWILLSPIRSRFHTTIMGPVAYMLSTKLGVGILGIGLTFAPDPLYPYYEAREPILGLTVQGDQTLAGELMTLEQMIVMGIALAVLLLRALDESERELRRQEHLEDLREAGELPQPASSTAPSAIDR
jgi:cytochrome c oxidase assembly factor CtaG